MLELNNLLNLVKTYNPDEIEIINRAYDYADELHKGQNHESGEPYISHPLNEKWKHVYTRFIEC